MDPSRITFAITAAKFGLGWVTEIGLASTINYTQLGFNGPYVCAPISTTA